MTLFDDMDKENNLNRRKLKTAGYTLMTSLKQAIRKGRLFCGMTPCSQLMSREPTTIMLCLLPDHCNQVSVQINHTLIKAFCHENCIPVLQLKNRLSIEHLIQKIISTDRHCDLRGEIDDMSCFLIKNPAKGATKEDKTLIHFYTDMMSKGISVPEIDLPA